MAVLTWTSTEIDRNCKFCSRLIAHEEFSAIDKRGKTVYYYLPIAHVGMCGKFCFGGWIDTSEILIDQIHDLTCSECVVYDER